MDLTVEVSEEGGGYWANVAELPGCFASARTLEELRDALGEAVGLYLWDQPVALGDRPLQVGAAQIVTQEPPRRRS